MLNLLLRAFVITLGLIGPAMAQERILISSDWGKVTAELVDNLATRSLVEMLPQFFIAAHPRRTKDIRELAS